MSTLTQHSARYPSTPANAKKAALHQNARKGFTLVEIMIVVVIIGLLAKLALPAFAKVRSQSRIKAVTSNLRQFAHVSQEFMFANGVTQAGYTDLVGTGTDKYLHSIVPAAGESYTSLVVAESTTQISVSNASFGNVTFNL